MTHWSYKCPINLMVTCSKPCAPKNEVFSENVFFSKSFLSLQAADENLFCKIISKSAEPTTTPYCVQNKLTCFKKIQGTTQLIRLSRRPDQKRCSSPPTQQEILQRLKRLKNWCIYTSLHQPDDHITKARQFKTWKNDLSYQETVECLQPQQTLLQSSIRLPERR